MNSNNHITYTAEDIAKYFSGQLSPQAMHAIEMAALDDDFLADAMEGYEHMKNHNWEADIAQLKQNLNSKYSTSAKVVGINRNRTIWLRAAAAVLLIGCIGTVTYLLIHKQSSESSNAVVKKEPTTQNPPGDSIQDLAKSKTSEDLHQPPVLTDTNHNTGVATTTPTINDSNRSDDTRSHNIPSRPNNNDDIAYQDPDLGSMEGPAKRDNMPSIYDNNGLGTNNRGSENFVGQVVDVNNRPIPFASIYAKKERIKIHTDAGGNFKFTSNSPVVNVEVNASDYPTETYELKSNLAKNKLVLGIDGKTQNKSSVSVIKDLSTAATPVDGWDNYNEYVKNNIEIPREVNKNNIQGEVQISFDVLPNGRITNIEVEQPLCNNCARAVKKVVQFGPKWKQKPGRTDKALLRVRF